MNLIIDELEQNEKNDNDDGKSSDSSIHSEPNQNDNLPSSREKNFTSLNKALTYLNFFTKLHHQSLTSIHPKHYQGFIHSQLTQFSQILDQQIPEQIEIQSDQNNQTPLDRKTHQFLSQYQDFHRQSLEEILLKSKRFKKTATFTNELIIHQIHPSKNYEIVKLDIQLMQYKTEICLFNDLERSSLRYFGKFSGSGASGEVYSMKVLDEQVAIKCIPFQRQRNNDLNLKPLCKEMIGVIKEYFFLLLFSQLRVGTQTKTIGGFDMIINSDVIQFATQVCEIPQHQNVHKMKIQLSESLFRMNMLNVVHRDIKPVNILYSPEYKKHVFIDFGCSEVINEILGQITPTHFVGTTAFCSLEMLSRLSHKNGKVDLYYNDLVGLRKSLKNQWRARSMQQQPDNQMNRSFFELEHMMYLLYVGKFYEFKEAWSLICFKNADQMEEIQMKLLQFFSQLKIGPDLRLFYWKQIDESIREKEQFKELKEMMKTNTLEILSEFTTYPVKQEQFSFIRLFYQKLMIEYGDFTEKEKQIENVISNRQSIEYYLANLTNENKNSYESEQLYKTQLIKMSLVVALYTSFASNQYNTNVEDKVKACSVALEILENQFFNQLSNVHLVFECQIQSLIPMTRFHQFFIFHFWHFIPEKFKSKTHFHCIVTIFLLGYPTNMLHELLQLINHKFLKKNDQKINTQNNTNKQKESRNNHKQKISKSNKNIKKRKKNQSVNKLKEIERNRQKLQRICQFWQRKMLILILGGLFYPTNSLKLYVKEEKQVRQQIQAYKNKLMSCQGQTCRIFSINQKFYRSTVTNYLSFNQKTYNQLFSIINFDSIHESEEYFPGVRKWRSLVLLVLCLFALIFDIKNSGEIIWHINKEKIFSQQYKNTILPYSLCLLLHDHFTIHTQFLMFQKFDNVINCLQVSFRFKIMNRMNIALEQKKIKRIEQIVTFLKNQIQVSQFPIQFTTELALILEKLHTFLNNYIHQLSNWSQQYISLFKKYQEIVNLGIEIGYNQYTKSDKFFFTASSISVQGVDAELIQKCLTRSRMLKYFFFVIIKVGKINQKVSVSKEIQTQNAGYQLVFESRHQQFLKTISQTNFLLKFSSQWIKIIDKLPIVKIILKSSQSLLVIFLRMYMEDRIFLREINKGEQIIEKFFESLEPKDFLNSQVSKMLPSIEMAFNYFQTKIVETNYGIKQCEQLIQLYKICAQKNVFFPIIDKPGLLRCLFNSHIYLRKGHLETIGLLSYMARNIGANPKRERVDYFIQCLTSFFWCKCKNCWPRSPEHWDPDELRKQLYARTKQFNISQNPYIAIVYFYSLSKKKLQISSLPKIVKLILRSITYLTPQTRRRILPKLCFFVYMAFQFKQRQVFMKKKGIKMVDSVKNIPKSQKNFRVHRRYLHNYCMASKHQGSSKDSIEILIQKRLMQENYFKDNRFPQLIEQFYSKKLCRFYEVSKGIYGQVIYHKEKENNRNKAYT